MTCGCEESRSKSKSHGYLVSPFRGFTELGCKYLLFANTCCSRQVASELM